MAITVLPLVVGFAAGRLSCWTFARPEGGVVGFALIVAASVTLPVALGVATDGVGFWDSLQFGALFAVGAVSGLGWLTVERASLALAATVSILGLGFLEVMSRAVLPPPPAFPLSDGGPHLLLAAARSAAERTGLAFSHADRLVCYLIYGEGEAPVMRASYPGHWHRRSDASAAILHLGDSMVYGGLREGRFTTELNRVEPGVEHVNASIAGTAPDVYLALLQLFLDGDPLDGVVMHLTPNDYIDLGHHRYSCANDDSLMKYDEQVQLRVHKDAEGGWCDRLARAVRRSPPPFVLRVGIRNSSFAAHAAAAIAAWQQGAADVDPEPRIDRILGRASYELAARRIPFVVNVWRDRRNVEAGTSRPDDPANRFLELARRAGVQTLDTWDLLYEAVHRDGVAVFSNSAGPTDIHFSADGHALVAEWLHRELPAAFARSAAAY